MSIQGSTNCVYVCASPKINNISIWDSTNIKQIKQKHVKYFYHIKRYSVLIKKPYWRENSNADKQVVDSFPSGMM